VGAPLDVDRLLRACEDGRVRSRLAVALAAPLIALAAMAAAHGTHAATSSSGSAASTRDFAARAPICRPARIEVLARSGGAVLFYRTTGPFDGKYGAPSALFACTRPRQRPVVISRFDEYTGPHFSHVSVHGDYAAYAEEEDSNTCGAYGEELCEPLAVFFESVDLRTGRARVGPTPGDPAALVVTARGWTAWIAGTLGRSRGALFARDSHGRRELDPGPVDPASLRVSGNAIAWTSATAQPGAATLG
jgi:hypothetical protein